MRIKILKTVVLGLVVGSNDFSLKRLEVQNQIPYDFIIILITKTLPTLTKAIPKSISCYVMCQYRRQIDLLWCKVEGYK